MSSVEARERRMARLRAQGGDRLARITKTFHPELYEETEKNDNNNEAEAVSSDDKNSDTRDDDPPVSVINPGEASSSVSSSKPASTGASTISSGSQRPSDNSSNAPFNSDALFQMLSGSLGANQSSSSSNADLPFGNDPLFQMLNEMKQSTSGSSEDSGSAWPFEDPFKAMSSFAALTNDPQSSSSMFDPANNGSGSSGGGTAPSQVSSTAKIHQVIWTLLHLLLCVYVASSQTGFVLRLCTGEIILHTTRILIDKGQLKDSMIATIAAYIGEPYGSYLRMSTRYLGIAWSVYRDLCVILFVYILLHGQVAEVA